MNHSKALSFLPVLLPAALSLAACSGPKTGTVCTTNCGGGDATVSFTLAAVPFTPPPGTSTLSFGLTLSSVQLTPSSGSVVNIPLNAVTYAVDLTRLQSDSAFLGQALANVPAGTYNKVTVGVTSAVVTYCTDLLGTSGCDTGSVAQVSQTTASTPATSTFSATLAASQHAAVQIQFNFANAITISTASPQVVSKVDLNAANVLTASTLAPTSSTSSLATGQLDFVEDVTGMVTAASSTSVTVKTSTRGSITATVNQSSLVLPNCVTTPGLACVSTVGQFASIDAALNSDGTFALLEYDPIAPTSSDWIEGIVTSTPLSPTQFQIVTNDIFLASANSLIGSNLSLGAPVQVTLAGVKPFFVDGKGFFVVTTPFTSGSTDATNIIPGQTVALHVTKFTAKNGNVLAAANVDTLVLRYTRVAGSISTVPGPTFNIQSLPPFFGPTTSYNVQLSTGSPSTNYDGVSSASGLTVGHTAAMRALFFGPLFTPAFTAAKVRQF